MAYGQALITKTNSVLVLASEADTLQQKKFFLNGFKKLDRPGKAAVFSAVLPGLGQAYNKAYWKIPIIYATGAVLGYFIIDNNNKYQDFSKAVVLRKEEADKYVNHHVYGVQKPNGTAQLHYSKDVYRRNRDLAIILSVLAYGMNITEAYVHGHLKKFDVNDNLGLRLQPEIHHIPVNNGMTPGMALIIYSRTK
jgi:hypothetical protein